MATPEPGWYTDPGDAAALRYWDGSAWTDRTRPVAASVSTPDVKPPRSRGRVVAIVAAAVLVAGTVVGGAIAVSGRGDDNHDGSEPDAITGAIVPSSTIGWVTHTSRSGAVTVLIDPAWDDLYTIEDEQAMIEAIDDPTVQAEIVGMWLVSGSLFTGGTSFIVIAADDEAFSGGARVSAESFARGSNEGLDDYTEVFDARFETLADDDAWRVDYTGSAYGRELTSSVIAIEVGDVDVVLYAASPDPFDEWLGDFLATAASVEVVGSPVSP